MEWADAESEFEDPFLREETLPRMFERSAEEHLDSTAQLYKGGVYDRTLAPDAVPRAPEGEYGELSYGEMRELVRRLAAGLHEVGLSEGGRVGIFADTRMEWALSDFAVLSAGGVVTTVYEGSSPEQLQYLLGDAGAVGVVVEGQDGYDRLQEVEDLLDLEFVVTMDPVDGADDDVYSMGELHDLGRAAYDRTTHQERLDAMDPDDLATLVYTSGTTGRPKGVKLTHRNVRANVNQSYRRYGPRPDKDDDVPTVDEDMRMLSYLPLAHIYERTVGHFVPFGLGATVAYAESPDTLTEDMPMVQPTGLVNVPRIFERIHDGMREEAAGSDTGERIFEWAMGVAREYHRSDRPGVGLRLRHAVADQLVYSTVREGMGGEVEMLLSGGGTLSKDLAELFDGMGLTIYEGYGMTEGAPVVTTNPPEQVKPGTIGPPVPELDVAVDTTVAPESQLGSSFGRVGELLVRGPNVTDGYWNKPEATESAFTEEAPIGYDGSDAVAAEEGDWFRTGDIVTLRPDGYVVFHERDKQMLVLSTGKNVAPAPVEDAFSEHDVVEQVMLVGDAEKFVGALVVPSVDGVRRWADRVGLDVPADRAAIAADERVRGRVAEAVDEVNERFESHEQIGDFRLVEESFTEENDLLTPTLKKKRRNVRDRFADEIADIYDSAEEGSDARTPARPAEE
jgi:long-chain acyl-CoA synthetase